MEYYINFAIIFTLIIAVITAIAYFVTKKKGSKKSPCQIFATVDVILTVIAGIVTFFYYIVGQNFGSEIGVGLYLVFRLPVALILLIIAIGLHFVFKRSK
ncbi:hypothetical protein [Ruminococcus sp.]|uniref:hypothetical protein n=1 Tax=Ruminococcus sp. TaxID=41978 RepID=UPI002626D989|nr:hypothetical protein [Ruminococcus sp.]MDD6989034.1 hypothetical protein [Ruminococcus sp.]MDY6201223.1 hypothetical protein [Ruminococcus sp.]